MLSLRQCIFELIEIILLRSMIPMNLGSLHVLLIGGPEGSGAGGGPEGEQGAGGNWWRDQRGTGEERGTRGGWGGTIGGPGWVGAGDLGGSKWAPLTVHGLQLAGA